MKKAYTHMHSLASSDWTMSVLYEDLGIEFEIKTPENAIDYIKANSIIILRNLTKPLA